MRLQTFLPMTRTSVVLVAAVAVVVAVDVDVDLFNETLKSLLRFANFPPNETIHRKPSTAAAHHMHQLYETFVEDDGSDDGNLVRTIDASVGKLDGQEVVVFDIDEFEPSESIMRAELHFGLRKRDLAMKRRARQIRARSICINEYCREQPLKRLHAEDDEQFAVWDATKVVFESFHLGAKQVVFKITRDHMKMRPYSEMIRKSSPFLVVYSQSNHTLDTASVLQKAENSRRQRRQIGGQYYTYSSESIELSTLASPAKKASRRRHRTNPDDDDENIWKDFGDTAEETTVSNDVRVILLQEKQKCTKRGSVLSFKQQGWDDWIHKPANFESAYCKGSCEKPLSSLSNPTNHALLQTLFSSEPVCCAPAALQSLTFLYRDTRSRLTIRNFESMFISSCGCL